MLRTVIFALFIVGSAHAHHFTSTVTGTLVRHFPSSKVIGNTRVIVYFRLEQPLQAGETLVARWTPPVIDGPCRVYEYTLPPKAKTEYVTTQVWNKAALNMFCLGVWICEILIRKPAQPDTILHETSILATRS